jgi:hypothetical protein
MTTIPIFDFYNILQEELFPLEDIGITVALRSVSPSVAILSCYQTDDPNKTRCRIPPGLYIEDKADGTLPDPVADETIFPLTWINDYDIFYRGDVICRLRTCRQWNIIRSITSPFNYETKEESST